MRGILFPNSNLIFDAQTRDPGASDTADPAATDRPAPGGTVTSRFSGLYTGWEQVEYAGVSLGESALLILTDGRLCENGRPVPVGDANWIKFSKELGEVALAVRKAARAKDLDAIVEVSVQLSDACQHCHEVYRDRRGGKAARCMF